MLKRLLPTFRRPLVKPNPFLYDHSTGAKVFLVHCLHQRVPRPLLAPASTSSNTCRVECFLLSGRRDLITIAVASEFAKLHYANIIVYLVKLIFLSSAVFTFGHLHKKRLSDHPIWLRSNFFSSTKRTHRGTGV